MKVLSNTEAVFKKALFFLKKTCISWNPGVTKISESESLVNIVARLHPAILLKKTQTQVFSFVSLKYSRRVFFFEEHFRVSVSHIENMKKGVP